MKHGSFQASDVFCPQCGSSHITLKNDTNVSWGRAATGWLLFGPIGAAVGAVTGNDRNSNACLNCGESWKASDLYIILQTVKTLTGVELTLVHDSHRNYLKNFLTEVAPYSNKIEEVKINGERKIEKTKQQTPSEQSNWVISSMIIAFVIGLILGAITGWTKGDFFAPVRLGFGLGAAVCLIATILDVITGGSRRARRNSQQKIQEQIECEKYQLTQQIKESKTKLAYQIELFKSSNALFIHD